jgi:hypothetical protein
VLHTNFHALVLAQVRKRLQCILGVVIATHLCDLARRVLVLADGADVGGVFVLVYGAEKAGGRRGEGELGESHDGEEEDCDLGEHFCGLALRENGLAGIANGSFENWLDRGCVESVVARKDRGLCKE